MGGQTDGSRTGIDIVWTWGRILDSGNHIGHNFEKPDTKMYGGCTGNVHNSSDSGLQYHPVYEYYAAGEYYTSEGAYLSGRVPEVGETIWIKYNPDKPKQSYIPGYDNKVYKILTIVFGLIGAVPILVCIGIAIWV